MIQSYFMLKFMTLFTIRQVIEELKRLDREDAGEYVIYKVRMIEDHPDRYECVRCKTEYGAYSAILPEYQDMFNLEKIRTKYFSEGGSDDITNFTKVFKEEEIESCFSCGPFYCYS